MSQRFSTQNVFDFNPVTLIAIDCARFWFKLWFNVECDCDLKSKIVSIVTRICFQENLELFENSSMILKKSLHNAHYISFVLATFQQSLTNFSVSNGRSESQWLYLEYEWNFNDPSTAISHCLHFRAESSLDSVTHPRRWKTPRKGLLMWHVYWNENNLNWKRIRRKNWEKKIKKKSFLHEHTTGTTKSFPQSSGEFKQNCAAVKAKSHSQTLKVFVLLKLHNTKISNLKSDFLEFHCLFPLLSSLNIQEYFHWFSLLLLSGNISERSSMKRNLCM